MTLSIYHVTLRYSGTTGTLLQCMLVPNWFERVILRRKKRKVIFLGHKQQWHEHPNGKPLSATECKRLYLHERELIALAKKKQTRILKFN